MWLFSYFLSFRNYCGNDPRKMYSYISVSILYILYAMSNFLYFTEKHKVLR